jgi:hypothetical protein
MVIDLFRLLGRALGHLVGLKLIALGLALVAGVALTPAWLANRELRWERELLRLQADRIAEQELAYQGALEALENHDPLLIERLAYAYLRLKPAGLRVVHPDADASPLPLPGEPELLIESGMETIESWLHKPLPRVGVDLDPPTPLEPWQARAAQVFQGQARMMVLGLGGVLCALGLLIPGPRPRPAPVPSAGVLDSDALADDLPDSQPAPSR